MQEIHIVSHCCSPLLFCFTYKVLSFKPRRLSFRKVRSALADPWGSNDKVPSRPAWLICWNRYLVFPRGMKSHSKPKNASSSCLRPVPVSVLGFPPSSSSDLVAWISINNLQFASKHQHLSTNTVKYQAMMNARDVRSADIHCHVPRQSCSVIQLYRAAASSDSFFEMDMQLWFHTADIASAYKLNQPYLQYCTPSQPVVTTSLPCITRCSLQEHVIQNKTDNPRWEQKKKRFDVPTWYACHPKSIGFYSPLLPKSPPNSVLAKAGKRISKAEQNKKKKAKRRK